MHVQLQYILLLLYMNLNVSVLFIPHFLNASTDTVSYAVRDQNCLGRGKGENPVMKILLITTGIISNFIITSTVYHRRLF